MKTLTLTTQSLQAKTAAKTTELTGASSDLLSSNSCRNKWLEREAEYQRHPSRQSIIGWSIRILSALTHDPVMVCRYRMATMIHRTSFALDEGTTGKLKRLAARWNVSQAEVVRRSVDLAARETEPVKPDPIAMLKQLHAKGGGLDKMVADRWIAEVYEDRKRWRTSS